ncbi:hypothetical protein EQG49_01615 [Periweissella cryptocerci]|uniref:Transposase IS30-like HTH domain-containing protein n=1 Tax=Periweissella cryptocerci TaxID=2506420 RepID=A0A4P6YRH4_9LACO|nr:helix-turn-helix domain-containing protein [Periweissella cryptocerci]QBO35247.1 hypothetical protein EQG49_01615 [Periweissella cryptocerci]
MTQAKSTTNSNPNHGKHLTQIQRGEIYVFKSQGMSNRQIALKIGINHTTIGRELYRGMTTQKKIVNQHTVYTVQYFPETGQAAYEDNRAQSVSYGLDSYSQLFWQELTVALKAKPRVESVDSFVHFFKTQHPTLKAPCRETVYRYIDLGVLEVKNIDLPHKSSRVLKKKFQSLKAPTPKILVAAFPHAQNPFLIVKNLVIGKLI